MTADLVRCLPLHSNRGRNPVTNQELVKSLKAVRALGNEGASSRERALALLVAMGVVTPAGELTGPYRQEPAGGIEA